jgi:hypothetical protein
MRSFLNAWEDYCNFTALNNLRICLNATLSGFYGLISCALFDFAISFERKKPRKCLSTRKVGLIWCLLLHKGFTRLYCHLFLLCLQRLTLDRTTEICIVNSFAVQRKIRHSFSHPLAGKNVQVLKGTTVSNKFLEVPTYTHKYKKVLTVNNIVFIYILQNWFQVSAYVELNMNVPIWQDSRKFKV